MALEVAVYYFPGTWVVINIMKTLVVTDVLRSERSPTHKEQDKDNGHGTNELK